jgi:NAD(P)-dependent dehydrogenase (short-subunit alcohol dehydrogenase family)
MADKTKNPGRTKPVPEKDLTGRVAVITGGASGIGRGSALAFARSGAKLMVADIDLAGAEETVRQARELGALAQAAHCDVGQASAMSDLRDATLARFGACDLIMNNVGVLTSGRPEDIPVSEWERVLNLNLMSVVRSIDAFLPGFLERGEGHIVNIASFAALFPYAYDRMPYAASKAAIVSLTEGLALYLQPKGIGVTLFCPGPVATNIGAGVKRWGAPLGVRGPGPQYKMITADLAGEMVVQAVRENRFIGFTDPQIREPMVARAEDWEGFVHRQAAEIAASDSYSTGSILPAAAVK